MAYDILQSSTQSALLFFLVQSSDHITGLTGASPTVTISKNGAAFASPSGAVTEISSGWYKVAGNATDTNTLGPLALHATATSADPCDLLVANIVSYNPQSATNLGLSAIPTATAGASGGLLISGSNSGTTTLAALTVTGNTTLSDGLIVSRTSSNTSAATFTGNGTGSGIVATSGSGATGDGFQATATSTNGNGMKLTKTGSGSDFNATVTPLVLAKTTNITGFNDITAAAAATGVWQDATAGDFTVASSIGKSLYTSGVVPGGNGGLFIAGTNAATTITTALTTTFTGNLTGSVGSVTGAVGSVTGNVGGNVTGSVGSVTAAVGITSNRKKGATATFEFLMQDSTTGAPKTGLTVSMVISKDGGAAGATSNAVTEIGLGQYQIVLTATEMTANNIFLQGTATGALTFNLAIQTQL